MTRTEPQIFRGVVASSLEGPKRFQLIFLRPHLVKQVQKRTGHSCLEKSLQLTEILRMPRFKGVNVSIPLWR